MASQFFTVDREESIGAFLLRVARYPQFKIPVLLECGAVVVRRDDKNVELKQRHEVVKPPEIVLIRESKCLDKLDRFPLEEYRDYAFVPQPRKGDEYLPGMRETLKLRPQTVVLDNRQNLQAFLDLRRSDIDRPVRDLLVVSHGNALGFLELPLDVGETRVVQYEDLQRLADDGSLKVNPKLVVPRPRDATGRELPFSVRFRGCQIGVLPAYLEGKPGAVPPLLALLKRATGARISAPIHVHATRVNENQPGRFEFFKYGFTLNLPEPLQDLAAADLAYRTAGGFTFFDGRPVPAEQWAKWLKAEKEKEQRKKLQPPGREPVKVPLQWVTLKSPVDGKDILISADLTHLEVKLWETQQKVRLASDPLDPAADDPMKKRRDAVREALRKEKDFQDSHPFPTYGRLGYRTLDAFVADLQIDWIAEESSLVYFYQRYLYVLRIPISGTKGPERPKDSKGQVLLANFYPPKPADPVILLGEEDERFFTTV